MSVDRPGETELELVQRRGREAEARARAHDAAIEAHRRNGTLRSCALPPVFGAGKFDPHDLIQGRRRRGNWGT